MSDTTETPELTGWGVTLYVREPEATSQIGAVESFLERVLNQGLRGFAYAVENLETGEMFFVERGEVYSQDAYLTKQGITGGRGD